jgi:hypothetical protein
MNSERSIGTGAHCRIGLKSNSELVRFKQTMRPESSEPSGVLQRLTRLDKMNWGTYKGKKSR